ncbi:urea ABC transporter permease subunit UrtB [Halioxenophilus aromaticivorans]|uniref:Urea ABC transporter permease subunit UrtB n=1 Tax=Halioxenophilus aromaticivorans TaxID=1306992 RepID=A0AAV3UA18_9ALTE
MHLWISRTILFSLCLLWSYFGHAQNSDAQDLLLELTEANLRETAELIPRLESAGGEQFLPLFNTLLAGDLYYEKQSKKLLSISKRDGQYLAIDVLGGNDLGEVEKSAIKKIRVNNSLRTLLRETIARINLTSQSAEKRLAAAKTMLGDVDDTSASLIDQRLSVEQDKAVVQALSLAKAIYVTVEGDEVSERVAAIEQLEGHLEPEVRVALSQVLAVDQGGVYTEPSTAVMKAAEKVNAGIAGKIKFYGFVEQLFFGLSLGSVLLLAAIGLAITFGVMGVINMAHGEMMMLGAYTTFVVQQLMPNAIGYSLLVAIPLAFIIAGSVGVLIERTVIRFLHGRPLETLLATFGISLILQQAVRTIFSPLNRQVITPDWMSGSWQINTVLSVTYNRLYILIFALALFMLLVTVLKKTSLGLNVRAVSQNRNMAKAIGIKTDRVDALTFGLGSGIAGVAGVALSQLTNVGPNLGQSYIIDSFMVVVFGGVGNLMGTLVGAFTLGIANKFLEPATGAVLANILILVFIILFIQKRPKGLFPQKGRAAND